MCGSYSAFCDRTEGLGSDHSVLFAGLLSYGA